MKIITTTLTFALLLTTSTFANAIEITSDMTAEAKVATKQVNVILAKCQKKLKLGKLNRYQQCAFPDIQKLAIQGNFAAQYQLAEWADFEGHHKEAMQWLQKGNDNPSTPEAVKSSYERRLQELQQFEQ